MSGLTWRVRAAILVVVAAVLVPLSPAPARAATARVVLADTHFTPPRLEVAIGDTVVWQAGDGDHTVTARDGTFDSSPRGLMADGDEYRYRFRVPGSYPYFCRVHQRRGMQGEIVVVDPTAPTAAPTSTTTRPAQPTAAAAPSSTATTATTATTAPAATTTSRPLATSSTTSLSMATATTAPPGAPAVPQEAPALNPNARVVGSPVPDARLPEAQAAARRPGGPAGSRPAAVAGLGLLVALGAAGGGAVLRARRRRRA
jgi:plastocyanin